MQRNEEGEIEVNRFRQLRRELFKFRLNRPTTTF